MSLESRIVAVVQAIGADIKALLGRSLPAGGGTGQVLTKTSATDYAVSWTTPASGGGGGAGGNPVYVQETDPAVAPPYIWFQTDVSGNVIDILKG
jgi:hypothetical protein